MLTSCYVNAFISSTFPLTQLIKAKAMEFGEVLHKNINILVHVCPIFISVVVINDLDNKQLRRGKGL